MPFDIRCSRQDLLNAIQSAAAVAPTHSTKPILSNLLLVAKDGCLQVIATDLQIGLRASVRRIELVGAGSVIVPAHQIASILKESTSGTVGVVQTENNDLQQVAIQLEDGSYLIPAVIGETFPDVCAYPNEALRIVLPAGQLERTIRRTAFAVDKERSSAVLSGQLIAVRNGIFVMTATDGKVLGEATVDGVEVVGGSEFATILPAATVAHLNRLLAANACGDVEMALAKNLIFARMSLGQDPDDARGLIQVELTGRVIEGAYPPYQSALEKISDQKVIFKTKELASAIRRTALMTNTNSRGIVMEIGGGTAAFSNLNHTTGSAHIEVACGGGVSGMRLGMNATYLTEVLRAFESDEISIEMNGANRGMVMRDQGATFLVMPISLPN